MIDDARVDPNKRDLLDFQRLNFFPDDLLANRAGRLSDAQRNSLQHIIQTGTPGRDHFSGFVLLSIVGAIVLFLLTAQIIFPLVICSTFAMAFLLMVNVGRGYYGMIQTAADAGLVQRTSGIVNLRSMPGGRRGGGSALEDTLIMECGGEYFRTRDRSAREAWHRNFLEGENYIIYHLPVSRNSDILLSFESFAYYREQV